MRVHARGCHIQASTLYDVGEDDGTVYLALEVVPSERLRTILGDRPLNPRRAIACAIQIADALADGHAAAVFHGSLTADTIIVTLRAT